MYGKSTPQPNLTQCIFDCKQLKYKVAEDSVNTCVKHRKLLKGALAQNIALFTSKFHTRHSYMLQFNIYLSYQTLIYAHDQLLR
jgi:hypothetical protein